jgi:hypothetical protein
MWRNYRIKIKINITRSGGLIMKKGCYWDALAYEFDENGNTVKVCKLKRKICPYYEGKCPALVQEEKL